MSCPLNPLGQPACYITAHPDRPHEKFCATCQKRFTEQEYFGILPIAIAVLISILIFSIIHPKQSSNSQSTSTVIDSINPNKRDGILVSSNKLPKN